MAGNVQGMAAAKAAFKRLPDVARDRLGEATRVTASEVARIGSANVPVRYGFLKKHIGFKFSAKTGIGKAGIANGTETAPDGRTVNPAQYGKYAEFGTVRAPAHPFMMPAAESQRGPYLQRAQAAGREIERDLASSSLL